MKKIVDILRLLRVKHYIKNFLVFVPLIFASDLINKETIFVSVLGFISFSFLASSIYILNDICDKKKDMVHPTKKSRPIASEAVSIKEAVFYFVCCIFISLFITLFLKIKNGVPFSALIYLVVYFILNVLYSIKLKTIPILDIFILVSGFIIRLLYGAAIVCTYVSAWLYFTVMAGAFFLVLGKRRNEIKYLSKTDTRTVLKNYNLNFLDKFMYSCLTMTCIFYALWAKDYPNKYMILTFPVVLLIFMQYSFIIEGGMSDGDPVEVLLKDRPLIFLCIFYVVILLGILFL